MHEDDDAATPSTPGAGHRPGEPAGTAEVALRPAAPADADAVTALVQAAYSTYVPRLGGPPGPMQLDYRDVIAGSAVTVAEIEGRLAGVVVTAVTSEGYCIQNVAVHPDHQGRGVGRALLACAEASAHASGHGSVYLYTHERMTENLAMYGRRGYVEYRRRRVDGAPLVFLRKTVRMDG